MADNYQIDLTLEEIFGTGISSIEQTTVSTIPGGANVWTVTLTNGNSYDFTVLNGTAGGDPIPALTGSAMTDTSAVYLYLGSETGYTFGHWYYYNGAWTDGGAYGAKGDKGDDGFSPTASVSKSGTTTTITITDENGTTTAQVEDGVAPEEMIAEKVSDWLDENITEPTGVVIDTSLQVAGAAADSKKVGDELSDLKSAIQQGGSFNAEVKSALDQFTASILQLAEKVAYIDEDGQDYYDDIDASADALHSAMYPPVNLSSISAVYTQSGAVYNTDSLDSLKPDLVVTAHYSDSTTATVTNYVLSGTLTAGISVITVAYGGKTTTFNVTVTEAPSYVTTGLIHNWDGINNTGNGDESHSNTTTTWADLVGSIDLSGNFEKAVWASNGLTFNTPTIRTQAWVNSSLPSIDGACTIEMAVTINDVITAGLGAFGPSRSSAPNSSSPLRKICIYSDGTLSGQGQSGLTYSNPESSLLDVHSISCVYNTTPAVTSIKVNGQEASASSVTHSLAYGSNKTFIGMADGSSSLYAFNGTIHAIRIYNRVLTDAERLQNYNMDVSRFGFGV